MKLVEMTAPELRRAAPGAVALLPIGAIEQHGAHLATSTDFAIASAIAERAAGVLLSQVVQCPSLPFGASHHHSAFGAMSFSAETFTRVVVELVESLLEIGFRRIVLLNGHGGNIVPASQALAVLSERYDDKIPSHIVLTSYWELAAENFGGQAPMESSAVRHACEYETSLMLHLHPDRVHRDRVETALLPSENAYINWLGDAPYRGVVMAKKFHFLTNTGAVGHAERATAAKGEYLFENAVSATVAFLKDFADWPILQDLREKSKDS